MQKTIDKINLAILSLKDLHEKIALIKDTCCYSSIELSEQELENIIYNLEHLIENIEKS